MHTFKNVFFVLIGLVIKGGSGAGSGSGMIPELDPDLKSKELLLLMISLTVNCLTDPRPFN